MSASSPTHRARAPAMLMEMARRGINARQTIVPLLPSPTEPVCLRRRQGSNSSDQTLVEAGGFGFTPPQHAATSPSLYSCDFDNAPPETMQPWIKDAHFGLPYAQRYNSQSRPETSVYELPQASLHVAPATIGYTAARDNLIRRAGRIRLSLGQPPKLGRVGAKVAECFQIAASNRPSVEPPAAFGDDTFRRYGQQQPRWHKAVAKLESEPCKARNSINSTSNVEHTNRVYAVLCVATLQQHKPRLVTVEHSNGTYQILPVSQ
ncbi:hypothetical protein GGI20_000724 [Coemansia sp. BCRC 34301]|nr:hypothetical protein GGI20_000724 [Coemansia sp. BCRC 34301]